MQIVKPAEGSKIKDAMNLHSMQDIKKFPSEADLMDVV